MQIATKPPARFGKNQDQSARERARRARVQLMQEINNDCGLALNSTRNRNNITINIGDCRPYSILVLTSHDTSKSTVKDPVERKVRDRDVSRFRTQN